MFKKFFTLVSLTTLSCVVASGVMAAGCSSSSGNTPLGDTSVDNPNPPRPGNVAGDCYSESDAVVLRPSWTTEYPGGLCATADVDRFFASCFESNGGSSDACNRFSHEVSSDCLACLYGSDKTTDLPALLLFGGGAVLPNTRACLAIQLKVPKCALPLQSMDTCCLTACQSCVPEDENSCIDQARAGMCGDIPIPQVCVDAINAAGDSALTTCLGANESFADVLKATAKALCVTGAPK